MKKSTGIMSTLCMAACIALAGCSQPEQKQSGPPAQQTAKSGDACMQTCGNYDGADFQLCMKKCQSNAPGQGSGDQAAPAQPAPTPAPAAPSTPPQAQPPAQTTPPPTQTTPPPASTGWLKHTRDSGMGFDYSFSYPSSFEVYEGDGTRISSPDQSVTFYVYVDPIFSDQLNPEIGVLSSYEHIQAREQKGNTTWYTIVANDGTYSRSYVITNDSKPGVYVRKVLGIEYNSQSDYNRYKQQYLQFKKSLAIEWYEGGD